MSFWYDIWSPMGRLIDLTGTRGCVDMGIHIDDTVEVAVQKYRTQRHRVSILLQIEEEILRIRTQGLTQDADVRLWKGTKDVFKEVFSSTQTWNITREISPKVFWFQGVWYWIYM